MIGGDKFSISFFKKHRKDLAKKLIKDIDKLQHVENFNTIPKIREYFMLDKIKIYGAEYNYEDLNNIYNILEKQKKTLELEYSNFKSQKKTQKQSIRKSSTNTNQTNNTQSRKQNSNQSATQNEKTKRQSVSQSLKQSKRKTVKTKRQSVDNTNNDLNLNNRNNRNNNQEFIHKLEMHNLSLKKLKEYINRDLPEIFNILMYDKCKKYNNYLEWVLTFYLKGEIDLKYIITENSTLYDTLDNFILLTTNIELLIPKTYANTNNRGMTFIKNPDYNLINEQERVFKELFLIIHKDIADKILRKDNANKELDILKRKYDMHVIRMDQLNSKIIENTKDIRYGLQARVYNEYVKNGFIKLKSGEKIENANEINSKLSYYLKIEEIIKKLKATYESMKIALESKEKDIKKIEDEINEIKKLENKHKKTNFKDLNKYNFKTFKQFIMFINKYSVYTMQKAEYINKINTTPIFDDDITCTDKDNNKHKLNVKVYKLENILQAIKLGKGTKWCTAAITNNMFKYYEKDDDIYTMIIKNNDKKEINISTDLIFNAKEEQKFQFHLKSKHFMDSKDKAINTKEFVYYMQDLIRHKDLQDIELFKYLSTLIKPTLDNNNNNNNNAAA